MAEIPRLTDVAAEPERTLRLTWRNGHTDRVTLAGWIATGGALLAPLDRPENFATARIGDYGSAVEWDGDDDLRIDAFHLAQLAAEQQPFGSRELEAWQRCIKLSNKEAADFFDIALSTWNAWRAGDSAIPGAVAIAARAALRDPVVMQAHYRPRRTGRPRRQSTQG